jgi:dihydrofolate synthase/folylpolyglutamate synthase
VQTLAAWEQRLNTLDPSRIELGLARVDKVRQVLFAELEMPPVVLIAGTNGKGSTVALCQAALMAAGYQVGAYTSPHLLRLNERIVINRQEIADDDFVSALDAVEAARGQTPLTYFEFITLAAAYHFARKAVDVALLEVGLGGRLDAVNVFEPVAAIVTNVGLDHMDWLGDTREAIGREKAGVFRARLPAIYADDKPVDSVIQVAQDCGAELRCYDATAVVEATPKLTGLPGSIRWGAQALLESLPAQLAVSAEQRQQGFLQASLAGRFQTLCEQPVTVVDVAHNAEATRLLAEKMRQYKTVKRWVAVFAAYKDKPIKESVEPLSQLIERWYCCQLQGPRAMPVQDLASLLSDNGANVALSADSVEQAWQAAVGDISTADSGIIVFGSFETVSAVMQAQVMDSAGHSATH